MPPHALHYTHGNELDDHRGRSVAHKGQRNARDGHDSKTHANVFQDLERPHAHASNEDESHIHRFRLHGEKHGGDDHPREQGKEHKRPDEPKLLGEEREDEVGLGLGNKPVERLRGVAKAEIKFAIEIEGEKKKALEGVAVFLYYFNN